MTCVEVVAVYGAANAGVRARALEWLDESRFEPRLSGYFGGASAGASQFLRRPHRAAHAELNLRQLAARRPASVLMIREASPLSRGGTEERVLRSSRHGVYDLDDALFHDVRGPLFERLFSKGSKASRAAAAADVVIVGNDYLADWATGRAVEVRVIPTCVEPRRYTRKADYAIRGRPRILWMGTPSGERYIERLLEPLDRLHEQYGARLVIVGSPRPALGARLERLIDRVPWRLDEARAKLHSYDVGIMPLPDDQYERGKCAYKLLEYGAAGLPVVASPVGVNAEILHDSGSPAPRTDVDWFDTLAALIEADEAQRQAAGGRLHDVVRGRYSFDAWRDAWFATVLPGESV